ncbi:hypothetical protein [Deinococcus aluminii]|uniref:Uncharacterized protein n=1 Tax=Deinococcus aluminii TaxID=1656885 RepID=A0ABP9XGL0_9DEIO
MSEEKFPALNTLFAKLQARKERQDIDIETWLTNFGSIPEALAYSSIFWPQFVEYQGCLLRSGFDSAVFESCMQDLQGNREAIERLMNHQHLTAIFFNPEVEETPEQICQLGKLLQEMWTLKLQRDYPDLSVQVAFSWHNLEENEDAQITVYCQR